MEEEEQIAAEVAVKTTKEPPLSLPHHLENKEMEVVVERLLKSGDLELQIEAARDIRKLVRKSKSSTKTRSRLAAAGVISPLVSMLHLPCAREPALLALLNLAVRNERWVLHLPRITLDIYVITFYCDLSGTHPLYYLFIEMTEMIQ